MSVLFCGARELELDVALEKLGNVLGLKNVMLEGGGVFDVPGKTPPKAVAHLKLKSRRALPGGVTWFLLPRDGPAALRQAAGDVDFPWTD